MKRIIRITSLFTVIALFGFSACQSKKGATTATTTTTTTTQQTTTSTTTTPPAQGGTVRYVVSFYSRGEGIDGKTHDEFVKFLSSYQKKIAYTPIHSGREGETDYCLALTELSSAEQIEFINKAKAILSKSQLVHQYENAKCNHTNVVDMAVDTYRLVVSFYSQSAGVDMTAHDQFEKFLSGYAKKIAYEPTRWGREGEVDYCLKLSELTASEQGEFVKKAKEILSKSTLVHVNENAACVHKH